MVNVIVEDINWKRRDAELQKKQRERGFEPWISVALAKVFAENGSIEDPHRVGHILVHRWGLLQSRESVFKGDIAVAPGDWVRIGYEPKPHDRWRVLSLYDGEMTAENASNYHTHETGVNTYIQQSSITIFRTTGDGSTLVISVQPLVYRFNDHYHRFFGGKIDLSSYVPASGQTRVVLVYLDMVSGSMSVSQGSTVAEGAQPPRPSYPNDSVPSAFVQLTGGQTSISTNDHVTDARPFLTGDSSATGGGGGGASAIDDLSDVTITVPADDEVLAFDSFTDEWINQTPAEAGLAEASHTHTESDITDLDHTDTDAIHDNVSGEFNALTAKASPVTGDLVIIEDSEDSFSKKKVDVDNFGGSDASAIHTDGSGEIAGVTEKTEIVTDDLFLIEDSLDSNAKKRVKASSLPIGFYIDASLFNISEGSPTKVTQSNGQVVWEFADGVNSGVGIHWRWPMSGVAAVSGAKVRYTIYWYVQGLSGSGNVWWAVAHRVITADTSMTAGTSGSAGIPAEASGSSSGLVISSNTGSTLNNLTAGNLLRIQVNRTGSSGALDTSTDVARFVGLYVDVVSV